MYNNQTYYTVTESNILENDAIATQSYTYLEKEPAYAKLYGIWAYAADKPEGSTVQCFSVYMTQTTHDRIIMLESKVFDYREDEPAPEPEPEEENQG